MKKPAVSDRQFRQLRHLCGLPEGIAWQVEGRSRLACHGLRRMGFAKLIGPGTAPLTEAFVATEAGRACFNTLKDQDRYRYVR